MAKIKLPKGGAGDRGGFKQSPADKSVQRSPKPDLVDPRVSRWWQAKGDDRAKLISQMTENLCESGVTLEPRAKSAIALYEGRQISALHPLAFYKSTQYQGDTFDRLVWNIPRSLCNTVQAKIAGNNKPKVQFMTTEGDWSQKRRARKLDRFVEGQFCARQGTYPDIWALSQRLALDACVIPGGAFAKVIAHYDSGQVKVERCFAWEFFVDPDDAYYGAPRSIVHRYPYDLDRLLETYPEQRDTLLIAEEANDDMRDARTGDRSVKSVWVYEGWRLGPNGKGGVHTICVSSGELDSEPWDDDGFPILRLQWQPEMFGFGGQSLIEEVEIVNAEVNTTLQRLQESERKTNPVIIVEEDSVFDEDITSNDVLKVIRVKKGAMVPPQYFAPASHSGQTVEWLRMNVDQEFELSGVSRMAATARKEQGVTAGVALRTIDDIQAERLSIFWSSYENLFVELGREMVRGARRLATNAEEGEEPFARWPGGKFLRTVKLSEADLPEEQYSIQIAPVNGIKNTPPDRLQLGYDMVRDGVLQPEALSRIVQYLDTPGEFARVNKQREWVEQQIENWLDAEEEGNYVFHPPIKFMVLEDAILQVAEAYFEALLDDIPEFNAQFFRDWMTECDRLLQQRAATAAQLQNQAGSQSLNMPALGAGPAPQGPMLS